VAFSIGKQSGADRPIREAISADLVELRSDRRLTVEEGVFISLIVFLLIARSAKIAPCLSPIAP